MERQFNRARDLLESVEEARSQVARARREVRELEARSTSTTRRYEPHYGGRSSHTGPSELWDRMIEKQNQLKKAQDHLNALQDNISRQIDTLPRPRWRMVLRCRYLDGMELPDIAQELSQATGREFSIHQIYRLHHQALCHAEETWTLPG